MIRSVPKPKRRKKADRAHNSTLPRPSKKLATSAGLKRGKRVKPVNRKRRQAEFARCYHSKERVTWVKALPCGWCRLRGLVRVSVPSDNAHVVTDGMGRKANYDAIAPLCRRHHQQYDGRLPPFDKP